MRLSPEYYGPNFRLAMEVLANDGRIEEAIDILEYLKKKQPENRIYDGYINWLNSMLPLADSNGTSSRVIANESEFSGGPQASGAGIQSAGCNLIHDSVLIACFSRFPYEPFDWEPTSEA